MAGGGRLKVPMVLAFDLRQCWWPLRLGIKAEQETCLLVTLGPSAGRQQGGEANRHGVERLPCVGEYAPACGRAATRSGGRGQFRVMQATVQARHVHHVLSPKGPAPQALRTELLRPPPSAPSGLGGPVGCTAEPAAVEASNARDARLIRQQAIPEGRDFPAGASGPLQSGPTGSRCASPAALLRDGVRFGLGWARREANRRAPQRSKAPQRASGAANSGPTIPGMGHHGLSEDAPQHFLWPPSIHVSLTNRAVGSVKPLRRAGQRALAEAGLLRSCGGQTVSHLEVKITNAQCIGYRCHQGRPAWSLSVEPHLRATD